jgi:hypothetical protein
MSSLLWLNITAFFFIIKTVYLLSNPPVCWTMYKFEDRGILKSTIMVVGKQRASSCLTCSPTASRAPQVPAKRLVHKRGPNFIIFFKEWKWGGWGTKGRGRNPSAKGVPCSLITGPENNSQERGRKKKSDTWKPRRVLKYSSALVNCRQRNREGDTVAVILYTLP